MCRSRDGAFQLMSKTCAGQRRRGTASAWCSRTAIELTDGRVALLSHAGRGLAAGIEPAAS